MDVTVFEHFKFLLEQADREVKNLWARSNLFLVVNTASLAGLLSGLSDNSGLDNMLAIGGCMMGVSLNVAWAQVHVMSRHYAERWLSDAHRLRNQQPELGEIYKTSMTPVARPGGLSATKTWYFVIGIFFSSWLGLLVYVVSV